MNLNLNFIRDWCESVELEGTMVDRPTVAECEYPTMCEQLPDRLDPRICYIIEASKLPSNMVPCAHGEAHPSILCSGKPDDVWLSAPVNLLYAHELHSTTELMNEAVRIFARYAGWERQMQDAVDAHLPASALGELAKDMLGNPLNLIGTSFHTLFHAVPDGADPMNPQLYESYMAEAEKYMDFEKGYDPNVENDVITSMLADPDYIEHIGVREAEIYPGKPFGYRCLIYNCCIDDMPIARVVSNEIIRPIVDSDYVVLTALGSFVTKIWNRIEANCYDLPKDYDKVLSELLSHTYVVPERIEKLLAGMKWQVDNDFMIMLLGDNIFDEDADDTLTRLSISLAKMFPFMQFTRMDSHSVFVCNLSDFTNNRDTIISNISTLLRERMVRASFSDVFHDFRNLYYYYHQALATEKAGMREDPMFWVYRYEDYAMGCIVDSCLEDRSVESIMPEGLRNLVEHDKKKGTSFVELLRIYLDNDRNIANTVREAYIHRNTFLYRIDNIKKILDMDLDDADNRIILQIALRALQRQSGGQPEK